MTVSSYFEIKSLNEKIAEQRSYIDLLVKAGEKAEEEITEIKERAIRVLTAEGLAAGAGGEEWAEELVDIIWDKEKSSGFLEGTL